MPILSPPCGTGGYTPRSYTNRLKDILEENIEELFRARRNRPYATDPTQVRLTGRRPTLENPGPLYHRGAELSEPPLKVIDPCTRHVSQAPLLAAEADVTVGRGTGPSAAPS